MGFGAELSKRLPPKQEVLMQDLFVERKLQSFCKGLWYQKSNTEYEEILLILSIPKQLPPVLDCTIPILPLLLSVLPLLL